MIHKNRSLVSQLHINLYIGLFIGVVILVINLGGGDSAADFQGTTQAAADIAIEITLPDHSREPIRLAVVNGERTMTLIPRHSLTINNWDAARDLNAVDIWADSDGTAITVRLSIIYNDLSNPEWWKDKKEKILGSFLVHEGEAIRPAVLREFGIAPFEMKAINARPIVFKPGEGIRVINNSKALEVVRLEKALDHYVLWLGNNSRKNVVAYSMTVGNTDFTMHGRGYGDRHSLIAAGETYREENLRGLDIESRALTIVAVVFDDGSSEGDVERAAMILALREGIKIEAPYVLRMVEPVLEVDDAEIEAAVNKLEAALQVIPEAIDKESALDLLKSKYPSFDEKTIGRLYEHLKSGLYEAKNMGLMPLGNIIREFRKRAHDPGKNENVSKTKLLRETLTQIKENFEGF